MDDGAQIGASDGQLSSFIGYSLKRALSIVQADLAQVLAAFDLRAVSFSALTIIAEQPGLTQTQLAEALWIEKSNLVFILDELMARGLILRAPVAHDRRRHALMPTVAGQDLARDLRARVIAHENRLFAGLSAAEQAELQRLLQKFRVTAAV